MLLLHLHQTRESAQAGVGGAVLFGAPGQSVYKLDGSALHCPLQHWQSADMQYWGGHRGGRLADGVQAKEH